MRIVICSDFFLRYFVHYFIHYILKKLNHLVNKLAILLLSMQNCLMVFTETVKEHIAVYTNNFKSIKIFQLPKFYVKSSKATTVYLIKYLQGAALYKNNFVNEILTNSP